MGNNKTIYETRQDAIDAYKAYIDKHIECVKKAYEMFGAEIIKRLFEYRSATADNTTSIFDHKLAIANTRDTTALNGTFINLEAMETIIAQHDASKYSKEEFEPYRAHHYPSKEDIDNDHHDKIERDYKLAWVHHFHNNKHHPEYWITNINGEFVKLHMDNQSFIEMICDWIAVSMCFNSSTYDWWINADGGRKEKKELLQEDDIIFLDKLITDLKFDFSSKK